ncbi:kinase-like domain-containing protein [Chytriomyces sp. MP71]|nr:kinase-like domain-containing protein [Chytriomyces sp. MP71]
MHSNQSSKIRSQSKWNDDSDDDDDDDDSHAQSQSQLKKRRVTDSSTASPRPVSTPHSQYGLKATHPHVSSYALRGAPLVSCRSVDNYEKLNRIEEGSYGIVYRARDRDTGEIVALKKLKLENEKNGFPVTTLREIHTLLLAKHPNIVDVREIVVTPSYAGVFIVMEFVEHDLKSLMDDMRAPFLQSEIKTLMMQLLSATECLHAKWIVHRDLKTSNLLMNNRGMMKVADFGLARRFGDPMQGHMTQLVVTLWYRAPELLLGSKEYSTAIDMWSIGCIFAELVNKEPLAPGKGEIDQLDKIFRLLGTPTEKVWPGFSTLPNAKSVTFKHQPFSNLRLRFPSLTENGIDLLSKLLTYDPKHRITASEALKHPFFTESPLPKDPSLFPTFPSKSAGEKRKINSPGVPYAVHGVEEDDMAASAQQHGTMNYQTMQSTGFRLKFM